MSIQVLVVEDEPKVQKFIRQALEQAGMRVETLDDLDDVEQQLQFLPYDVLVLDRLIKNQDSLGRLIRLKKKFPRLRVLILSALGELDDRVAGLELGADDYLAKPFHVTELIARIRSLGRRGESAPESAIRYQDLKIDLHTQEVRVGDNLITLTAKEFKLLTLLAQKPNRVFSKAELLDRVWGFNSDPSSNVVEVTLTRLRSKLDEHLPHSLIHTKRGSGYWFGEENTAHD